MMIKVILIGLGVFFYAACVYYEISKQKTR
jgi:hypothetical protein